MKQFIRNFRRQSTVGILNIFSLSVGIMVFIIIGLWTVNNNLVDDNLSDMESRNNESCQNYKIELLIKKT